jgi:AraC-like DNA-binding protein
MPFAYREQYTAPSLSTWVRKFWVLDNAQNDQPVHNKNVLPNSCFNLAYVTGQGLLIRNRRGELAMPATTYFCGQARASVDVVIQPRTLVTMVQLHPWALTSLTEQSLADSADGIIPLAEFLPELSPLLLPSYQLASGPAGEAAVVEHISSVLPTLVRPTAPAPLLQRACQRLQQVQGCLSIAELAQELQCSPRTLEKHFRQGLGLTPKEFTTVLRVRGVVDTLQAPGPPLPLAQVALAHGFYDQAHFIHAFRRMVQLSPGRFNVEAYLLPLTGTGY